MLYQDTVASLKESKETNIKFEIEVDKPIEGFSILKNLKMENISLIDGFLQIEVKNKNKITDVIDILRAERISIYQVSNKNNLEELFLSLTEN
jgi:ABC-2 type transport system ATP-binding protein